MEERRTVSRTIERHEHEWHLSSVEFDDGASVVSFECEHCPDVVFR
ncbi:hypothetical protein GCM10009795_006290 [Nocardioides hankookensis]